MRRVIGLFTFLAFLGVFTANALDTDCIGLESENTELTANSGHFEEAHWHSDNGHDSEQDEHNNCHDCGHHCHSAHCSIILSSSKHSLGNISNTYSNLWAYEDFYKFLVADELIRPPIFS